MSDPLQRPAAVRRKQGRRPQSRGSQPELAAAGSVRPGGALPADALVVNSLGFFDDLYGGGTPPIPGRNAVSEAGIAAAIASGLTATNYTLPSDTLEEAVRAIGMFDEQIRGDDRLRKIYSVRDILAARAEKQAGIIYGWQNTLALEDKPERVDIFADLGLRIMQLTYNPANRIGGGAMDRADTGLTAFGRDVVERLNARRLVVDLSHSGERLCRDALAASRQPICITHTGCRSIADSPRNKTDAELRGVADKGGYVGIFFIMYLRPYSVYDSSAVVAHIEHALNICGEDHVGIGSDCGTLGPNQDRAERDRFWAELVARRVADGSAAEGDDLRFQPYPTDMEGPGQFRALAEALRKRGMKTALIEKIFGRNFLRYLGDVWGG
jgi:membrane dipeptidase